MKHAPAGAHPIAAAVAAATLSGGVLAARLLSWRHAPAPFVWLDVAVVSFVAALPLAASLATMIVRGRLRKRPSLALLLIEAAALISIPRFYVHARCQSDIRQAFDLLGQSRYGEASELLNRILVLRPRARWNDRPLASTAASVAEMTKRLQARVAQPLSESAPPREQLARAQHLAMLGRTRDALRVLDSGASLANLAQGCNLYATIYETEGRWAAALTWYERAKKLQHAQLATKEKQPELARAITGIAYCQRKLGRLHQAEAAWHELLAISPSADTHFLLAQFYEDTQQAAKARAHVQAAMQLDPARYERAGRQLEDKLLTSHFGCLGIFAAERRGMNR